MISLWPDSSGRNGFGFLADFRGNGSIVATRGNAPTFTRASTATTIDHDLVVRHCLSGEARMVGQRRVENLANKTVGANTNTCNFTLDGATVNGPDADGFYTFTRISAGVSNWAQIAFGVASAVGYSMAGKTFRVTMDMKLAGPLTDIRVAASDVLTTTNDVNVTSAIGASAKRISVLLPNTFTNTGYCSFGIKLNGANGESVAIRFPMMEDVTGQSNQNPAEYVSVGVLSAPFHGVNVDGVRYFPWLNGNTVASNVVTEAQGARISTSINRGFLAEPAATNLCLQSADFSTSWTRVNILPFGSGSTLNATASPDGTVSADLITEDTTAVAQHYLQAANIAGLTAAQVYTASCYFKPNGRTKGRLVFIDSTTVDGVSVIFDLSAVTVGAVTAAGTGVAGNAKIEACANGFYRVSVSGAMGGIRTTGTILLNLADAAGAVAYTGDGVSGMYFWGADLKAGNLVGQTNTHTPTTTTAVTRAADSLTYATTGWLNANAGTLYAEWLQPSSLSAVLVVCSLSDGTGANAMYQQISPVSSAGLFVTVATVTQANISVAVTAGVTVKAATPYAVNDFAGYANNVSIGTDTSGTLPTVNRIEIGSIAGASQLGNPIAKVIYYPSRLPNAVAQGLTV